MNNRVLIDLDKSEELPQLSTFQRVVDIKKNGRIIVQNSVLENIDTISKEELIYIFKNLKGYISPVVTSQYIPSIDTMKILSELAPEFKVRFKTERPGANLMMPISPEEFFEGERIFSEILQGIKPEWGELQIYKYLYNRTGQMLSYDLNTLEYTQYRSMHERYSRNIFTAMSKNWGLCSSFAASYDYLCYRAGLESQILSEEEHDYVMAETKEQGDLLTDPTFDSTKLKFGMRARNFGISKRQFIENGHNLEEAEVGEYEFDEVSYEAIKQLDIQTGYLDEFGGEYTDDYIASLGNSLEGSNNSEKILSFLNRIGDIKTGGRPTAHDYETIINFVLAQSNDREFADRVKVYSFVSENTPDLPRQIALEVCERGSDGAIQYYVLQNGLKDFKKVDKIECTGPNKEK